jgi:hypothetical protein
MVYMYISIVITYICQIKITLYKLYSTHTPYNYNYNYNYHSYYYYYYNYPYYPYYNYHSYYYYNYHSYSYNYPYYPYYPYPYSLLPTPTLVTGRGSAASLCLHWCSRCVKVPSMLAICSSLSMLASTLRPDTFPASCVCVGMWV